MSLTQQVTWIPIEERLPRRINFYPVAGKDQDDEPFTGQCWFDLTGFKVDETVTHWAEPLNHPDEL